MINYDIEEIFEKSLTDNELKKIINQKIWNIINLDSELLNE